MSIVVSPRTPETPIIDSRTGMMTWEWVQWFKNTTTALNNGLNILGQFIGTINADTKIQGRAEGIGTTVQHINDTGVVNSPGMTAATTIAQGAVVLPAGAVSNVLGSAALSPTSAFDVAGSAATAQANAEAYANAQASAAQANAEAFATTAASNAQSNAEAFASNASNLASGTVASTLLPVTYGTGAPIAAGTENALYFDTTAAPYHGYVYHGGAWVQFS